MPRPERVFTLRELTRLLGLTPKRAGQLRRLGLLRGDVAGYRFRELVSARAASALLEGGATVKIWNDLGARHDAFDAADARSLIDTVRVIAREINFGPTAVIVADDTTYGMLRMLETLLEGVCDVRPFRDAERNAAEQWLRTMPIRPRIES